LSDVDSKNRDYLKRLNYPRQSYAISGTDYGDSEPLTPRTRSKRTINGAPMIISNMPPGANADSDESWQQTYGTSMDGYLSLLDGNALNDNILEVNGNFSAPYSEGLPTALNTNLYEPIGDLQQIQFIVGRETVDEVRQLNEPMEAFESRGIGLRMPAQIAGWGKTIAMRPTDPEPENARINDDEHKMDRGTWKVGPLDARWDNKRKTWRAFNDLIADDEGQGLGTFVFSTNPDATCGFPFLRGRLEDVWSVRKTHRESSTDTGRNDDDVKSGKVCIKLAGHAFDAGSNRIGQWNDVFEVTDHCGEFGVGVCGSETTTEGFLSILTDAKFSSATKAGSIVFAEDAPDDVIFGAMYYNGAGACGSWAPGITLPPICDLGAQEFGITFDNDKILQAAIETLCKSGVKYNRTHRKELASFERRDVVLDIEDVIQTISGFGKVEAWTATIIQSINANIGAVVGKAVDGLSTSVQAAINKVIESLVAIINAGFVDITTKLAECSCDIAPYVAEAPECILPPVSLLRARVQPAIDLQPEISELTNIGGNMTSLADELGTYIGTFDLPIIFPLGTIKDPCDPTTTVTKNCTI
jgi:hypothetical protein